MIRFDPGSSLPGYRALGITLLLLCAVACRGRHEEPNRATAVRVPSALIAERAASQQSATRGLVGRTGSVARPSKQILFGDLHVHTTFSADAFWRSLPMHQGEGPRPPAAACDFARFCSQLDFWALTDHAETLSPRHWRESIASVRECNAAAGSTDTVTFLGWEWTQAGEGREGHYGHRTVLLRDVDGPGVPERPIAAPNRSFAAWRAPETLWQRWRWPVLDLAHARRYLEFNHYRDELRSVPLCPPGREVRSLPPGCHEVAATPAELFGKLGQWGVDSLVVVHGMAGDLESSSGTAVDAEDRPELHALFEIYLGHGRVEQDRAWHSETCNEHGTFASPTASADCPPCCSPAGEPTAEACGESGACGCRRLVDAAPGSYREVGRSGFRLNPDASGEDWKDCGQCRDFLNPALRYRPEGAAQHALARRFDDRGMPRHFRFGFVGSSASHSARPGRGCNDRFTVDSGGGPGAPRRELRGGDAPARDPNPLATVVQGAVNHGLRSRFPCTGGLSAVHATGRGREEIWSALRRREVYATSGDRILLWFDLLNSSEGPLPMGAEVGLGVDPIFRVRAIGAAEQLPGCPGLLEAELSPARLAELCEGECHHPGAGRRVIVRIEVVRIRPQQQPGEAIDPLIEDPWRQFACPADPAGCVVEFSDPEFVATGRETLYYVRAIQEPSLGIDASGLRCETEASDRGERVRPSCREDCTGFAGGCLGVDEERAWSSPIFVRFVP